MSFAPPFSQLGNSTVLAASTTSTSATLPGSGSVFGGESLRVYNAASSVAFFRTAPDGAAPTAVTTDTFIAPGATEVFSIPANHTQVAVILATGTGNVYFQRGAGS